MGWFKHRTEPGSYKVKGVTPRYWNDTDPDCATRQLLKVETRNELDEYYTDGEDSGVPGAFGEGGRRPRRERRKYTYRERRERQQKVFKEWLANWKRHNGMLP